MKFHRSLFSTSLLAMIFVTTHVKAREIGLAEIWQQISKNSHLQKAAQYEKQASEEAALRTSRHWLPRVYLDARGYRTNDPGESFIGLLEQRSLVQSDFDPNSINHPKSDIYTRGALGVDLSLYEGGLKSAEQKMQKHVASSKEKELQKIKIEQYSEIARTYGSIAILKNQKTKLEGLSKTIEKFLKRYQIGSKSNPIGYSGLLGFKSVYNRVLSLINQYESQNQSNYTTLNEMGLNMAEQWQPEFVDSVDFVAKSFALEKFDPSANILILKEKANATKEISKMEKARFLPRVGTYAETYVFNGTRNEEHGYTAGVYLQWSLFNPSEFGKGKESELMTYAAKNYAQAMEEKERAEYKSLLQTGQVLRESIRLINENQKLLEEQVGVTEKLFKNGSINALQFAEVLSRHVDLITSQTEADLELIKVESEKILKTQFSIPKEIESDSL